MAHYCHQFAIMGRTAGERVDFFLGSTSCHGVSSIAAGESYMSDDRNPRLRRMLWGIVSALALCAVWHKKYLKSVALVCTPVPTLRCVM